MKNVLLLASLAITFLSHSQNLVSNGNFEQWSNPNSTPNGWSSASDFGSFNQNTTTVLEGNNSAQLNAEFFSELFMFTTVDIPLQAGITYTVQYSYRYLGSNFDTEDNIRFRILSVATISNPFINTVNIQDSNWNTVTTEFTPTVTDPDYSVEVYIEGPDSEYQVVFDDIRIVEKTTLNTPDFNLEDTLKLIMSEDNIVSLKKPSQIDITEVSVFSIMGTKQNIETSDDFSTFDASNLSSGLYIFNISTNQGNLSKKVVIK